MIANELYNMVAEIHKPPMSLPYAKALDRLINTRFETTTTKYCTLFLRNLENLREAAVSLKLAVAISRDYSISHGMASMMLLRGTAHIR